MHLLNIEGEIRPELSDELLERLGGRPDILELCPTVCASEAPVPFVHSALQTTVLKS